MKQIKLEKMGENVKKGDRKERLIRHEEEFKGKARYKIGNSGLKVIVKDKIKQGISKDVKKEECNRQKDIFCNQYNIKLCYC